MQILPRPTQIVAIQKAHSKPDIKPAIEQCFMQEEFIDRIEPYLANGMMEGHKLLDQLRVLEVAIQKDRTGLIEATRLTTKEKIDQMMVVVRRHYTLDKRGKFISVNPKRYQLLDAPKA